VKSKDLSGRNGRYLIASTMIVVGLACAAVLTNSLGNTLATVLIGVGLIMFVAFLFKDLGLNEAGHSAPRVPSLPPEDPPEPDAPSAPPVRRGLETTPGAAPVRSAAESARLVARAAPAADEADLPAPPGPVPDAPVVSDDPDAAVVSDDRDGPEAPDGPVRAADASDRPA
jgi:hypothetical protein